MSTWQVNLINDNLPHTVTPHNSYNIYITLDVTPFPPPRGCVGGAQSLAAGQRPRPLIARALYARTSVSVGASEASMGSGIDVGSGHWCAGGRQVRRRAGGRSSGAPITTGSAAHGPS